MIAAQGDGAPVGLPPAGDPAAAEPGAGAAAGADAVPDPAGVPEPPAAARLIFGDRLALAVAYVRALAEDGVTRGLIGPREIPRLWDRHVLNCAVLQEAIPPGATVADVGSGAGLPGIPLALVRPDLTVILLEPSVRRSDFLTEVVHRLDLRRVEVVRSRAEEGRRPPVDMVTARAVAPLARLVGWCLPLVAVGGRLLAIKGASAQSEMAAAAGAIKASGGRPPVLRQYGFGVVDPPTSVVEIVRASAMAPRRRA
jgi:16S rRNA (guanine527-N7)-methyltransferase